MADEDLGEVLSALTVWGNKREANGREASLAEIASLTVERDVAQTAANAAETKLADANQRVTELEERLAEALNANTSLRATVDELMRQLTAAKVEIERLEAELAAGGGDPDPEPDYTPDGYRLHTALRFAEKGNYFIRTGTPSNSGANRRASQCTFGAGPRGTALMLTTEYVDGVLVTGEVTTEQMPRFPAWEHRVTVVEFLDEWTIGLTPSPWDRSTNGDTEVDDIEWFGYKIDYPHTGTGQAPAASGLHLNTYIDTPTKHPHKAVQVRKHKSYWAPGAKHVLETRISPSKIEFWCDGEKTGELLPSQFPAGMYAEQMNSTRYLRWCIQANPGSSRDLAGNLPDDFERFRMLVHSVDVYVPVS